MRGAFLLVLMLLLVAVGCGSEPRDVTKGEYEQQLQRLGTALVDAGSQVGQHLDIATFNEDIQNLQDELRSASKQLKGLKPPLNAQGPNKRLADAFHDLADALEPVKDARRVSLPQGARKFAAVARRSPAALQGRAAVRQLRRRGYDVGQMVSL